MDDVAKNKALATHSNQVVILKDDQPKQAYLFGVDRIYTGVENPNEREIITQVAADGTTYKEGRNKVEAVELFNVHKQSHHNWILLDLETGGRGWYPGAKEVVDISNCAIYESPTDTSKVLQTVTQLVVADKLDLEYGYYSGATGQVIYYKIAVDDIVGYVLESKVHRTYWINK